MKSKIAFLFSIQLFLLTWMSPAFALEHSQKDGLFRMDIQEGWHWVEYPQEIVITYPDGKTVAIDIQFVDSSLESPADIKKAIKEGNDRMLKEGVEKHQGVFVDEKTLTLDGVYATQLDFKTSPPNAVLVSYVSTYNKHHAITFTYASREDNMRMVLDDLIATVKFR